jgi:hypothetical protein
MNEGAVVVCRSNVLASSKKDISRSQDHVILSQFLRKVTTQRKIPTRTKRI